MLARALNTTPIALLYPDPLRADSIELLVLMARERLDSNGFPAKPTRHGPIYAMTPTSIAATSNR